jgi:two-component system, response regulator PdtaR
MSIVITGSELAPNCLKPTRDGQQCSLERTGLLEVSFGYAGAKVAESAKRKDIVLVVEDDVLVRMNTADVIRDLGFTVLEAVDADQAIALLESTPAITVLFTDIQMPGSMDGLRLAAVVRDRWPPVALLITSGQVSPHTADMPSGAHFIQKPHHPLQIGDQLRELTGPTAG